jgi:hypothetical protein
MKARTIVLLSSSVCLAALAVSTPASADAASDVRSFFDKAAGDFAACNIANFDSYNAAGRTGYYPDSAALQREDTPEAKQAAADFCTNGGKHDLNYEVADVVMLKDAALVLGAGHYKRTEPDGTVTVDTDYTFTDVLVKTKDGWKFRHGHIGAVMAEQAETAE